MATSVTTSLPMWLTGCTYDADMGNDLRNSGVTAYFYDEGIVSGGGTIGVLGGVLGGAGLLVSPGTGMAVSVQPGSFVVPASATPTAGGYASTLSSTATLTVQTADPTNPRIDLIVAYVLDAGSSSSFGAVEIITGTAAPSPSAPSAPANSLTLAQLTVPATTTSITSGMLADERTYTTAVGGILVAPKGSVTGYTGQLAYDKASGSFYHNNNTSSATQMHVLPWTPVVATRSTNLTFSGSETSVLTCTFTADGYTDVEAFFKWPGLSSSRGSSYNFNAVFRMYIDSSQIDGIYTPQMVADGDTYCGSSWSYYTSSATGDTPSAGTHTLKVTCQNLTGSYSTTVTGLSTSKVILRVEPVAM
jgi:hypothetical protein